MKRNPLLSTPPKHYHRVQDERRLTKYGWDAPHLGVHTTTEENIAAGYAYSGWVSYGASAIYGWPAVVTLDVSGLSPEPDVDALLWWYERGGKEQAKEVLDEGEDFLAREEVPETDYGSVLATLINDVSLNWNDVVEDSRMFSLLGPAIEGDHEALKKILLTGFPQRRYMNDFDLDRVVEIRSFQPWYDPTLEYSDEDLPPKFQKAEDGGWEVVAVEDLLNFSPRWKTLWTGRSARKMDYHGTTSVVLEKAFPELFSSGELPNPHANIWRLGPI